MTKGNHVPHWLIHKNATTSPALINAKSMLKVDELVRNVMSVMQIEGINVLRMKIAFLNGMIGGSVKTVDVSYCVGEE